MAQSYADAMMFNTGGRNLIDESNAVKIELISLEQILENNNNFYDVGEERIDDLASDIEENGLLQNGVAFATKFNSYMLLSGHSRLKALQKLVNEGKHYLYNGVDITGKYPLSIVESPKTKGESILTIIRGNNNRDYSDTEKGRIIEACLKALNELEEIRKFEWSKGVRKAHIISEKTGIKEHFIKDYLAKKAKADAMISAEDSEDSNESTSINSKEEDDEIKQFKKIMSGMKSLAKKVENTNATIVYQIGQENKAKLLNEIEQLKELLKKFEE